MGGGLISRFPLGLGAVTSPTSFRPPRGKSRPNLTARLETNSLKITKWARVATCSWRAQTWRRLNNHTSTGSAKLQGLPASPRCSPENALCSEQHCRARAHTQMHTRNSCETSGGLPCGGGNEPGPPLRRKDTSFAWPPPRTGGNPVTSPEATAVTAPCGKGEGAPQPRPLYTSLPKSPSCTLTFLGGGCMMLKGHQSSPDGGVS